MMEKQSAGISISIKQLTLDNFRGFTLLPKLSIGEGSQLLVLVHYWFNSIDTNLELSSSGSSNNDIIKP